MTKTLVWFNTENVTLTCLFIFTYNQYLLKVLMLPKPLTGLLNFVCDSCVLCTAATRPNNMLLNMLPLIMERFIKSTNMLPPNNIWIINLVVYYVNFKTSGCWLLCVPLCQQLFSATSDISGAKSLTMS